jgi:integrase
LEHFDRDDVARWLDALAKGGSFSRRSVQIFRMVLRATFADALDEGLIARNPAARVGLPRDVVKSGHVREVDAWSLEQLDEFLGSVADHRWAGPIRLLALYGLRRSELLALKWDDIDFAAATVRVDEGLVEVSGVPTWTAGKNERSRRTIPIDGPTLAALRAHRKLQLAERMLAGERWEEENLVVASQHGRLVNPRNFAQSLDRLVAHAAVPRLTSHGLRHTAATHMVKNAADAGELRAIADVLGHSPDMLMRTYAHALPESIRAVADKVALRTAKH